jgi:hypothetical protein
MNAPTVPPARTGAASTPSTAPRIASIVLRVFTALMLGVSTLYVFVYLYRWEWHRAIVAGLFALGAGILLASTVILAALHRIERRLDALDARPRPSAATSSDATATTNRHVAEPAIVLREASPASRHFAWLARPDSMGVFVPILIGAGVLLSGIAYVIERVGAFVARGRHRSPHPLRRLFAIVASVAVSVVALIAAVDVLRDATETRPEPWLGHGTTHLVVDVDATKHPRDTLDTAAMLWSSCRDRVNPTIGLVEVTPLGEKRVDLLLDQVVGPQAQRRLTGCIDDIGHDLVLARVVGYRLEPARSSGGA